jgi:F420-0:gamma-glutamyl ligase
VEAESTCFLPAAVSRYGVYLTIKENALMPYAGIDESNSNGYYVLWPERPQQTADQIWATLRQRFGLRHAGVVLTDSRPLPLRWGVTGFAVAHSGFRALRDYRGQPDLFGRPLRMTQANLADALAAAAVLAMGEGNESTPLARITGLPAIEFQERAPSPEELANLATRREDDLYAPLLDSVPWQHGQG